VMVPSLIPMPHWGSNTSTLGIVRFLLSQLVV
jgi:hypothetical protein